MRRRMVRDVALVYPIGPVDGGSPGQPASWLYGAAVPARDAAKHQNLVPLSIVGASPPATASRRLSSDPGLSDTHPA